MKGSFKKVSLQPGFKVTESFRRPDIFWESVIYLAHVS